MSRTVADFVVERLRAWGTDGRHRQAFRQLLRG
jgi:hypothetical protein